MENKKETKEMEDFTKVYEEWLQQRPKHPSLNYLFYSALTLVIDTNDEIMNVRCIQSGEVNELTTEEIIKISKDYVTKFSKYLIDSISENN